MWRTWRRHLPPVVGLESLIISVTLTGSLKSFSNFPIETFLPNHMSIYLHVYPGAWIRECQLTPVFLPKKSHGQRSLVGYSLWVTELDMTEILTYTCICG